MRNLSLVVQFHVDNARVVFVVGLAGYLVDGVTPGLLPCGPTLDLKPTARRRRQCIFALRFDDVNSSFDRLQVGFLNSYDELYVVQV